MFSWIGRVELTVEQGIEAPSVENSGRRLRPRNDCPKMVTVYVPTSPALGDVLFELRVGLNRVARRVTFYFALHRRMFS